MKNLRKIIALFIFIFLVGITVSVISINKTLHKKTSKEPIKSYKDTLILIKVKKENI